MQLTIKKGFFEDSILIFIILMNILGSYFYLISQSYSIGFLCLPILLLLIFVNYKTIKIRRSDLYFFSFFSIFFISCLLSLMFFLSDTNLRVLKFLISMGFCYLGLKLFDNKNLDRLVAFATIAIITILLLQYCFLFLGFGINPSKNKEGTFIDMIPSSVYGNPNDLSIIGLLLFIYFKYQYNLKYKYIFMVFSGLVVLVAASRFSILLLIIIIVSHLKLKEVKLKRVLVILVIAVAFLFVKTDYLVFFEYSINRLFSITTHLSGNISAYGEDSISLRINSLFFFLNNLINIDFGSMVFKNYNVFFRGSQFYGHLIAENPHNFFVEISLLYGWFGVLCVCSFVLFLISGVTKFKHKIIVFISLIVSFLVTSSVINFLPIWVLIFIIILNKSNESSKFSV